MPTAPEITEVLVSCPAGNLAARDCHPGFSPIGSPLRICASQVVERTIAEESRADILALHDVIEELEAAEKGNSWRWVFSWIAMIVAHCAV
jgi:hypothetical protein